MSAPIRELQTGMLRSWRARAVLHGGIAPGLLTHLFRHGPARQRSSARRNSVSVFFWLAIVRAGEFGGRRPHPAKHAVRRGPTRGRACLRAATRSLQQAEKS